MSGAWKAILAAYGQDYQGHLGAYRPSEGARDTAEKEIAFYRSLRTVEERSFERVGKSGIFAGISEQQWEELGKQAVRDGDVTLQEGFDQFIGSVKDSGARWGVVSVNFSRAFIRGVLASVVGREARDILILANQPDENGVIQEVIATSDAKLASAKDLIELLGYEGQGSMVYLGDSGTDIECLLRSDITGIILSEDGKGSLMETLNRIGIEVPHVGEYRQDEPQPVYWARNYLEVVQGLK